MADYKIKLDFDEYAIKDISNKKEASITEENYNVKIKIDSSYVIEDTTKEDKIKILMLKGEKGETGGGGGLTPRVVNSLPTSTINPNYLYLVPKSDTGINDLYDEYIYVNDQWELIGVTQMSSLTNIEIENILH